jgi:Zn-dependent peptidase ImmA (M78 family)/DNA-binding XRE family transcriptional regulator
MPYKSIEAIVEKRVLIWARESMGLSIQEVAKKLKTSEDTLNKCESGQKKPTLVQIEKLAKIYKRPLGVFFLPEPPKEQPLPKDFRTIPKEWRKPFSPKTLLAIRRARRLQSLALELTKNLNLKSISEIGRVNLSGDPEVIASKIRIKLNIRIKTQLFKWKDETEALNEWTKAIEKLGVLVFQMSMPIEETRGFSLTEDGFSVIVINAQDTIRARIFSLIHEFGHILLNDSGICNMEEMDESSGTAKLIEKFCNHFAGAVLVPKDILLDHKLIKSIRYSNEWPDEFMKILAREFKVSQEVILRRLVILGRATRGFYKTKREEWEMKIKEKKEIKRGGRSNPPKKCIRENGIPFISLVLESHKKENITYSDVADYLAIRLKHLPKIEQFIRSKI